MFRFLLALVAITMLTSNTSAQDLGDVIKTRVQTKIAQRIKVTETRTIDNRVRINGDGNVVAVSADNSQNVTLHYREGDVHYTDSRQWHDSHDVQTTTTTTDSRQWHLREGDRTETYAPRYREGSVQVAPRVEPYCPPPARYVPAPRLTYEAVTDDCPDTINVRCWSKCGKYFIDAQGRRWNLLPTYSVVTASSQRVSLSGRYWRTSSGQLMFTAIWPCGTIRTFVDP